MNRKTDREEAKKSAVPRKRTAQRMIKKTENQTLVSVKPRRNSSQGGK